jgi:hypothetical protein
MPGYLDQYGVGEERRLKIIKSILIVLAAVIVIGGPLMYIFHNYRQESQVKQFFRDLQAHDYQAAYALWGCSVAKPCVGYSLADFMRDWGNRDVSNLHIARSRSCGSGVILTVDFGKDQQEKLWVERKGLTIGFSPFPGCPATMTVKEQPTGIK